ncbi:MAG: leucine-rich repeat domain-containing protein [Anaerofustis stercorihominis]|nr:leucine-rich repeat domain-containing protein [Anaerofustis stercorihominis]
MLRQRQCLRIMSLKDVHSFQRLKNMISGRSNKMQVYVIDKNGVLIKYIGDECDISIPEAARYIGEGAFSYMKNIRSVKFSYGTEEIGDRAFANCESLEEISFSNSIKRIGDYSFRNCPKLRIIKIPFSVKSVGTGAFMGCSSIEKVIISEGLRQIGTFAFSGCRNLKDIFIPDSAKIIGENIFDSCTSLRNIVASSAWKQQNMKLLPPGDDYFIFGKMSDRFSAEKMKDLIDFLDEEDMLPF